MDFAASINRQDQKNLTASTSTFSATCLKGRLLVSSMATFSGSIVRFTLKSLNASMSSCSGVLLKGRLFVASMSTMSGSTLKTLFRNVADCSMSTFDATFTRTHPSFVSLSASMSTFAASIIKTINKFFNAS